MKTRLLYWLKILIPVLVFSVFGYYLLHANFGAKLGMIDDHEIAMFLSTDGKINPSEIIQILQTTEVGEYGQALRFRPVYYTFRIIESMLWGTNATWWFLFRAVLFVLSFYWLYLIIKEFFPSIIAYLFVFYSMTMPFWPDLLSRLGPSEIYCVPALMAFVYGLIKFLKGQETKMSMAGFWLGYLICVGSKENFLILLPILILVAGYRVAKKKVTKGEVAGYFLLTFFSVWIMLAIYLSTHHTGSDFYLTSIDYPGRIIVLWQKLPQIIKTRHIEPAILIYTTYWLMLLARLRKKISGKWDQNTLWHLAVITIIMIGIGSQYIFYNNTLPTNSRYDFPALLLFPILNLMAVHLFITSLNKNSAKIIAKTLVYMGLIIFMLYYIVTRRYTLIQNQAIKNAQVTTQFEQKISLIEEVAKAHPDTPLIFESFKYFDFEPVVSISRYLRARGVTNTLELDYTPQIVKDSDNLGQNLNQRMVKASELGKNSEQVFENFEPYKMGASCYSITFGKSDPGQCEPITSF